jgi:ABC-2 type transport system permease protein
MSTSTGAVLAGVLQLNRRAITLWCVAVAAVATMYTSFYPSVGGAKMAVMMEAMPPDLLTALGMEDLASAAGYVSSTVYALLGAILTLVCTIGLGARLLAGAEEDGTLELEATSPVSRTRIYGERLLALWVVALAVTGAVGLVILGLSALLDLGLSAANVGAATVSLTAFTGSLGTLALAVGAVTGRRPVALGAAAGVAVVAYLGSYLGPLVDGAGWLKTVSPYDWYIGEDPLTTGFDPAGLGLLAALTLLCVVAGLLGFRRRDLGV